MAEPEKNSASDPDSQVVRSRGSVEEGETLAASARSPDARPMLGARYEVLGLLGSGGMGNVYKARDLELDEVVALKVLRADLANALERLRREVKLARRVTHPNVARVYDIGEHGHERILTMELVDGESLSSLLRREGALPLARAIEIARAICAGVGAAHAAGVVHRDLKPDNVLLRKDGHVVVTDFGIARAAEGVRTAGFIGTPAYMAPEQIDEKAEIGNAADIYALGCVLYEMLTGEPAWQAESLWAIAAKRLLDPPPDPRAKRPDVPASIAELVLSAMARDVGSRPPSMAELERALAALVVRERTPPLRVERAAGADKRVAVLPFANLGPADQEYVADGLTEDLIDALSAANGLRVCSRGVVLAYKGASRDPREVGRELDVHVVVEGSVRRSSSGFRINARAVSVADGFQLWARRFSVTEENLLVENDAIARAIAQALGVDLATPDRAQADAKAVDVYLRARHAFQRSFSQGSDSLAELWDDLVALTPDDPRALAGHATAIALKASWPAGALERAMGEADRAIALAPMLSDGYAARGALLSMGGDPVSAIASLRRAVALSPSSPEARETLGRILYEVDHPDCLVHLEAALASEPAFEFPYITLAGYHLLSGDRDRADEYLERARARGLGVGMLVEARAALWLRDREIAARLLSEFDRQNPRHAMSAAWCELVLDGVPPPPISIPRPPGHAVPAFLRKFALEVEVEIACFSGDVPRSLALLHRLDAERGHEIMWLERTPVLEELRAHPDAAPIRARFAERAAEIVAAYRR